MDCNTALAIIGEWGEGQVFGKEARGCSGDAEEAFAHIRECRKRRCSRARDAFKEAVKAAAVLGNG